ncbi:Alginate lyase [uncultured virus]|nr:Alginate lyase [uncultured virus]
MLFTLKSIYEYHKRKVAEKKLIYIFILIIIIILLILIITLSCTLTKNKLKKKPPSYYFNLSNWEFQSPIRSESNILIISPDELTKGYSSKYFYTAKDYSMAFMCPLNGAHTPNTNYPRSELREVRQNGDWNLTEGIHILKCKFKVIKTPHKSVFVGQVHGNDENFNTNLVKIKWTYNNEIDVQVNLDTENYNQISLLFGQYNLGEEISYIIKINDGYLQVSIINYIENEKNILTNGTMFKDPYWNKQKYYFKAGNYLAGYSDSSDHSIVQFYYLNIEHQ